jgi:glycosyltransferase involved in cell wall biosynthesis
MRNKAKLSLIIPAYNEAPVLRRNVDFIEQAVRSINGSYEIIIAEDGSTDGSDEIAAHMARQNPRIIHSHAVGRLGKGQALRKALKASTGEIIVFMDADLATSLSHLPKLLSLIESGYDGAVGSRHADNSVTSMTLLREFTSQAYNFLARLLFGTRVRDHQCGFKAFHRKAFESIVNGMKSNGFIFDTELIVKGKRKGLLIAELPVTWTDPFGRRSKFKLLEDGPGMLLGLLKLRVKLWKCDIQGFK